MLNLLATEAVNGELVLVSLDKLEVASTTGIRKQVALLMADAAIALGARLNLGNRDLIHKGTAVAAAAVVLGGVLRIGHCVGQ